MPSMTVLFPLNSQIKAVLRIIDSGVERHHQHAGAPRLKPKLLSEKHIRHWKSIISRHRGILQAVTIITITEAENTR